MKNVYNLSENRNYLLTMERTITARSLAKFSNQLTHKGLIQTVRLKRYEKRIRTKNKNYNLSNNTNL